MTCDNLRKCGLTKPLECVQCTEIESVYHLFFECIVARLVWIEVEELFHITVHNFEYVAKWWLCEKRCLHLNVIIFVVLWGLWNFRNYLVFNRCTWISLKRVFGLISRYLMDWMKHFNDLQGRKLMEFQNLPWRKLKEPFALEPD